MNQYQIVDIKSLHNDAGSKATADVAKVAERIGFQSIKVIKRSDSKLFIVKIVCQVFYLLDWVKAYLEIKKNGIVLIQNPFRDKQLGRNTVIKLLKSRKNIRIISLVHDVEQIRSFLNNKYYDCEFKFMKEMSDIFIVHNDKMKVWFENQGVAPDRLISLEIFDYLIEDSTLASFSKIINIAGNLDSSKGSYIGKLSRLNNVSFNLFGSNYNLAEKTDNIIYRGSFTPEVIPNVLTEGFGLVWDGNDIDTCSGPQGEYLKYNNPHKLSLYISAGLPVFIWSEAAEAVFVKNNGLGYCIDSLYELNNVLSSVSKEEYNKLIDNVSIIKDRVVSGKYICSALNKALEILN